MELNYSDGLWALGGAFVTGVVGIVRFGSQIGALRQEVKDERATIKDLQTEIAVLRKETRDDLRELRILIAANKP